MKISFDIDGVLDTPQGMALARRKIANGDRVYIITGRNEERMAEEVYAIARELGIPRLRVYFTNGADKWKTIQSLGIELHYDNNEEQITKIKEQTDSEAELVEYD
jgi:acid phosphatase class B